MKKVFSIFLFFITFPLFGISSFRDNIHSLIEPFPEENLKGGGKEMSLEVFYPLDKNKKGNKRTVFFNRQGNKTQEINFGPDGKMTSNCVFSYDLQQRIIETTCKIGKLTIIENNSYLNNSYEISSIKKTIEFADGKKSASESSYSYETKESAGKKEIYQFDGKKNQIGYWLQLFDANKRIVEENFFPMAAVPEKYILKYNSASQVTEIIKYHQDPLTIPSPFVFDYHYFFSYSGSLLSTIESKDQTGKVIYHCSFFYDKNGFKTKEFKTFANGKKAEILFIHDSFGNPLEEKYKAEGYERLIRYSYAYWN